MSGPSPELRETVAKVVHGASFNVGHAWNDERIIEAVTIFIRAREKGGEQVSESSPELLAACAKHVPSVKTDAHEAWLFCSCGMQSHRSGQTWSEWWINHTAEWVHAREQAARLAALKESASVQCIYCKEGMPWDEDPVRIANQMYFHKDGPNYWSCTAWPIRALVIATNTTISDATAEESK